MKKILALALFAVALVSCRQTMQTNGFKLSGHLEGLQVGDTLFLKTFLLPDWKEDGTDTILVEKEGIFSAFIPMEHTTFYLLTHQPKVGEPLRSCIKAQAEGTVITLDGLTSLMDNNQDMFQVTQGKVREGLPMLRAEVRLIGKEGLTGAERDAQLAAFRELILDTNRQNFFIKVNGGKEIHMRGYAPTSAYKAEYEALVAGDTTLDANVYYSNTKGSTWGVKLPVGTRHAYERVPFREAYPDFNKWVDSKGASNQKWYENFVDEKTIRYW